MTEESTYKHDEAKVKFYTGLPFFKTLTLHAKCRFIAYMIYPPYAKCVYICTGVKVAKPNET